MPPSIPTSKAEAIELSIDSGHVRALRSYQARGFEVFVARISNDDRKQITFSSVPAEADQQTQQLRGVLQGLGATSTTETTILSDGADGPRSLAEAACVGPTFHVLDWFHLAMRIHHVAQAVKGWPKITVEDRGDIGGNLGRLGDTATASTPAAAAAGKVSAVLRGLETYVAGQADFIIDYATARHGDEPISTAPTEGTVRWPLHRRMGANQQMHWSPRGAHLMLKVRTAVTNCTFDLDHAVVERWAKPPFRRAA